LLPIVSAGFGVDPFADVSRTVFQTHAVRLALREKLHAIPIDKHYVSQIERDVPAGFL
jgi:hypothetical protein